MIIYSIVPSEIIFGEVDEGRPLRMDYLGASVEVLPSLNGGFVISRVLSTSPKTFLNPKLQPGMRIGLGE